MWPVGNSSLHTLFVLRLASGLWAFSFGVEAPVVSLWLNDYGYSAMVIGLNTGAYYFGIMVAAAAVPWLMRRLGKHSVVLGTLASAVTVAAFPWGAGLVGWFILRWANGAAGAISLIPLETLVSHNAAEGRRARDFGFYAVSVALGIGLGTLVGVQLYALAPVLPFLAGGLAALLSTAVLAARLRWPTGLTQQAPSATPLPLRQNVLSFGSAWSQGFLEGGMMSLLPVYLLVVGVTETGVGWILTGTLLGVIAFQVPVAWLADRLGRTRVLVGCYLVTALSMALVPAVPKVEHVAGLLFLAGACSGALYPLGLALLGEHVPPAGLARANAWYLAINCLGSLTGPVLAGAAMDQFGHGALFATAVAALLGVLGAWGMIQWWQGPHRSLTPSPGDAVENQAAA